MTGSKDFGVPPGKRRKIVHEPLGESAKITEISKEQDLTTMLPVDCLYQIFKWLDTNDKLRATVVCKRWHNIIAAKGWAEDGVHLDLTAFKRNAWRKISQKRGRYTTSLVVDSSGSESLVSRIIPKYFHRLENLTITLSRKACYLQGALKFNMNKIFENIKKFKVLTMRVDDMKLIEDFIDHVPPEVSKLSLQYVSSAVINRCLSIDLSRFPNLQSLEVINCKLNEDSFTGLHELEHLRSLILKCHGGELSRNPLKMFPTCAKLEKLVLRCNITDQQLRCFLRGCPNLRVFIVLYNGEECVLTVETMKALSLYCPNLQELYFYGHFLFAEEPMPHFPNLKTLVFTDPECGPYHKNRIAEFIERAPRLNTLFASSCTFHPFLHQIHDVLTKRSNPIPLDLILPSLSRKWYHTQFSSLITIHSPVEVNHNRLMRFLMQST